MPESEKKVRKSQRQEQQTDLLEEALSRPGIRELMLVYQGWEKREQQLDSYRTAASGKGTVTTSDHANVG